MSKISKVNSIRINPSQVAGRSVTSQIDQSTRIIENFNFKDAKLKHFSYSDEDKLEYLRLLKLLFITILEYGISIVPTNPRQYGETVTAGSLEIFPTLAKPSHMFLPINDQLPTLAPATSYNGYVRFVNYPQIDGYIEQLAKHNPASDLLTLLIICSHEYGHYQSFLNGNHDKALKLALLKFHKHLIDLELGWVIFREECIAWQNAATRLQQWGFSDFHLYNKVKANSLQTYYHKLNLKQADSTIHLKLSLLGDDYLANCNSNLF